MDIQGLANIKEILSLLDFIGTFFFAISGAMAASSKKLDLFGAAFLAFVTALGGGTIRDLLIGSTPVGWMNDISYLLIIISGVAITFLFYNTVKKLRKTLFLFDTIGIGVFTILGIEKALIIGITPFIAIMMGMFSAVLGGVIRDILISEIPLIFRKEIYATACLIGGALFIFLQKMEVIFEWNVIITILTIVLIRIVVIRHKIGLPGIDGNKVTFPRK